MLDDGETVPANVANDAVEGRKVDDARLGRAHRAELHRGREVEVLGVHARFNRRGHALQVQVRNPFGVGAQQRGGVAVAVLEVTGVEAEVHHRRVGIVEKAVELRGVLHHGVGVGMERELQTVLVTHEAAQLLGRPDELLPLAGLQVVGSIGPVGAGDEHEEPGAESGHQFPDRLGACSQRCPVRGHVESVDERAGDDAEIAPAQLVAQPRLVGRQVPVGPELDGGVPRCPRLVEEPVPRRLTGVVGEPHAPRVGRGSEDEAHRRVSVGAGPRRRVRSA